MGRHARARKRTNVPRGRRGQWTQPEAVDEEPTRVDAERPLDRLEDLAATPMRWGRGASQQEAEGAPAWSEAPWLMRDSRGC